MKKSFQRILLNIVCVTFTWGQVASAYPQNDVPALKNFLQRSGWTKGDVKLKDIYEMTKNELPLDFRFEIERMLEMHPNLTLPKLEVRMIKNGRFEDVQLIAQKGRQAASATLSFRGDQVATVTYPMGGKDVQRKLTMADIYNPVRMMANAYGPGTGVAERIQFTRFLYSEELALLRPQDRLNYSEQVREALRLAERAQNGMNGRLKNAPAPKKSKGPSKTSMIWTNVIPEAFAAGNQPTGSCLVLGWISTYKNGVCEPPNEAKNDAKCGAGGFICSTTLYGANAECGVAKFEQGQLNSTAESCNMRNKDNKYDYFLGIKSKDEFDKKMKELSLKINEIRLLCKEPKNEQINECQELEKRMAELMKVNCQQLSKWKEQFTDLKCTGAAPPAGVLTRNDAPAGTDNGSIAAATPGADIPIPQPDPVVDSGGRDGGAEYNDGNTTVAYRSPGDSETAPPRADVTDGIHCEGLPLRPSGLDCAGGSVSSITCNSRGEQRTHYYCVCTGGLRSKYSSSAKPIGCEADRPAQSTDSLLDKYKSRDRERRTRERASRPEKSWWEQNGGFQGMLGGLLTVGVGFFAYYQQQQYMKQQWEQYYKMYQPQQLRIAPPPTAPVVIPGTSTTIPGTTIPVMPGTR